MINLGTARIGAPPLRALFAACFWAHSMLALAQVVLALASRATPYASHHPVVAFRSRPYASLPSAEATPALEAEDALIDLIEGTDRGIATTADSRDVIAAKILQLERGYAARQPLSDAEAPFLLRRAEVAYVGQASSGKANAAGGRYRGRVGRLLFRTDALFQHVLAGAVAVNVIQFRLLGLLRGCAVLRGTWAAADSERLAELQAARERRSGALPDGCPPLEVARASVVSVDFEPPLIAFGRTGRLLTLRLGPTSRVGLDVTYLSERLRICRGASSGTPFVFRSDTCADGASLAAASQQWQACVNRRPLGKRAAASALLVAAAAAWALGGGVGGGALRRGALPALFTLAAAALARSTGGIVVSERNDGGA